MPQMDADPEQDVVILEALNQFIQEGQSDIHRPFLRRYQEIIETTPDEISELIVEELSQDPSVEKHLRKNIISVHTLLPGQDQASELNPGIDFEQRNRGPLHPVQEPSPHHRKSGITAKSRPHRRRNPESRKPRRRPARRELQES